MAKILLVEDDNNLREIYQARLVAEGYDIVAAQNGEEALVVAKQNKPDLIISDVMMPRISGFEMLDILRNTDELKHTKVIMLTALGQAEDQKRAGNLGADKYLVKSQVTLEDIVNAAKELLLESGADMPAETSTPTPAATPAAVPAPDPTPSAPPVVDTPAPAPEPAVAPAAATPASTEPVIPASVVPQPDTTVVVPPAPASTAAPTVTAIPTSPEPTAAADTLAPTPEPVAEPAPAAAPESEAPKANANVATQTLEKEEAELQAQIDNYANAPAEPAIAVEPAPADSTTDNNEETLADAVKELNSPTEEPPLQPPSVTNASEAPAAAPAPAPAPAPEAAAGTPTDNVSVAGKKVIQPINPIAKPNLDELLAKEEATAPAPPAAPTVDGQSAAPQAPQTPPSGAVPGQSFDPNTAL